mmetsp:Transcript_101370/g.292126  ORF Transcript_101370/g.292126 Transcript_101370/m.292126 type:complete len:247 (-) Transcript_101370:35-775(-)
MQATHFVPDEIVRQHGLRESAALSSHTNFAHEVVGSQPPLPPFVPELLACADEVRDVLRNVLHATSGRHRRWVLAVWGVEFLWILGLTLAAAFELWHFCPLEEGPLLACQHCFGGALAFWSLAIAATWSWHLQVSVLLASRNFVFLPRRKESVVRGAPLPAIRTFVGLSVALLIGFAIGVVLLFRALTECSGPAPMSSRGGRLAGEAVAAALAAGAPAPRSELMAQASLATVLAMPALIGLGRAGI